MNEYKCNIVLVLGVKFKIIFRAIKKPSLTLASISLSFIIILSITVLPCVTSINAQNVTTTDRNTNNNFLTYANPESGTKIRYPFDWEKVEDTGSYEGTFLEPIVIFLRQEIGNDSHSADTMFPYQAAVSLAIGNLTSFTQNGTTTLKQYTALFLNSMRPSLDKIIESNATIMAGNPAHKVVYQDKIGFNNMALYTIKDNKIYLVGYVAESGRFSNYLPTVQKMIDSLEITR